MVLATRSVTDFCPILEDGFFTADFGLIATIGEIFLAAITLIGFKATLLFVDGFFGDTILVLIGLIATLTALVKFFCANLGRAGGSSIRDWVLEAKSFASDWSLLLSDMIKLFAVKDWVSDSKALASSSTAASFLVATEGFATIAKFWWVGYVFVDKVVNLCTGASAVISVVNYLLSSLAFMMAMVCSTASTAALLPEIEVELISSWESADVGWAGAITAF